MTPGQIDKCRKDAEDGTIPDDKNPLFILQGVHTDLLVKIVNLDFNLLELAKYELKERGLNQEGKWVGFKSEKAQVRQVKNKARRKGRGL